MAKKAAKKKTAKKGAAKAGRKSTAGGVEDLGYAKRARAAKFETLIHAKLSQPPYRETIKSLGASWEAGEKPTPEAIESDIDCALVKLGVAPIRSSKAIPQGFWDSVEPSSTLRTAARWIEWGLPDRGAISDDQLNSIPVFRESIEEAAHAHKEDLVRKFSASIRDTTSPLSDECLRRSSAGLKAARVIEEKLHNQIRLASLFAHGQPLDLKDVGLRSANAAIKREFDGIDAAHGILHEIDGLRKSSAKRLEAKAQEAATRITHDAARFMAYLLRARVMAALAVIKHELEREAEEAKTRAPRSGNSNSKQGAPSSSKPPGIRKGLTKAEARRAVAEAGGNKTRAAGLVGCTPRHLRRVLKGNGATRT